MITEAKSNGVGTRHLLS